MSASSNGVKPGFFGRLKGLFRRSDESTGSDDTQTFVGASAPLALQLRRLGLRAVAIMNMTDEAEQLGIRFDAAALAAGLDCPVCFISAKYGRGFPEARETLRHVLSLDAPTASPTSITL